MELTQSAVELGMAFFVDLVTMDEPQLKMLLAVGRSHPVLIHIFQCSCSTFAGWATRRSAILSFKQLFLLGLWLGTGRLGKSPCLVSILLFSVPRSLGRDILDIAVLPRVRTNKKERKKKKGEMRKMEESFSCPEGMVFYAAPCGQNETCICVLCTECRPALPVPKQQQTSFSWSGAWIYFHFLCLLVDFPHCLGKLRGRGTFSMLFFLQETKSFSDLITISDEEPKATG